METILLRVSGFRPAHSAVPGWIPCLSFQEGGAPVSLWDTPAEQRMRFAHDFSVVMEASFLDPKFVRFAMTAGAADATVAMDISNGAGARRTVRFHYPGAEILAFTLETGRGAPSRFRVAFSATRARTVVYGSVPAAMN